ncbi:MAG: ribonucleoside-diphosphate reductase subunit alpha [Patescibacteria group bacterium]
MQVQTARGLEPVDFNKIMEKVSSFTNGLHSSVDPALVTQKTIQSMVDGISTAELDKLSAQIAANLTNIHPDYSILGARILMSRLHKHLDIPNRTFAANVTILYNNIINGIKSTRIAEEVYEFIQKHEKELEDIVDYDKDFKDYDYQALTSMMKRGLESVNGEIAETPAQMFLRVAVGLNIFQPREERELAEFEAYSGFRPTFDRLKNMSDEQRLANIKDYYQILVQRNLSLPGPIILHAGSEHNQMSSCYLQYCGDSLTGEDYPVTGKVGGIMRAMSQLAKQSQGGGGNAIAIHDIRAAGSPIRSTNGKSNGILPFMKMFDATIGAINQSGKRAGTCVVYLEPWHADILDFLDAGNHFTIEERRCKNLFYALWMNDLFFERLVNDKAEAKWTLFDPAVVANHIDKPLSECYGEEFRKNYLYLESLGVGKTISLMEIWGRVMHLFQTTGVPYIVNKDQMNLKSNQRNIGTIKSSNLCTEIALVSNEDETAVCVLSSVVISRFLKEDGLDGVDYDKIIRVGRIAARNLNNVIDLQYYPTPETRNSCLRRRAIGIGIQGLADLFHQLKLGFTSEKAKEINKRIYECLYFGTLWESMELAKQEGAYDGFEGSPVSQGELQYHMWGLKNDDLFLSGHGAALESLKEFAGSNPWEVLIENIKKYGIRNSEVTALAPTAASSVRMSGNDMHEPYTRNLYVKQHIAGSAQVVNRHLVKELVDLGLWSQEMYQKIVYFDGSVQPVEEIPQDIKDRYRTVYELDWKELIDMMADRSPFVSQTSSFNHYTTHGEAGPTAFTQKIVYAWKKGLKTLSYYMHTETASTAKKELGGITFTQAKPFINGANTAPTVDLENPAAEMVSAGSQIQIEEIRETVTATTTTITSDSDLGGEGDGLFPANDTVELPLRTVGQGRVMNTSSSSTATQSSAISNPVQTKEFTAPMFNIKFVDNADEQILGDVCDDCQS